MKVILNLFALLILSFITTAQNMTPVGGGVHVQGEIYAVAEDTVNHITYIGGDFNAVDGIPCAGVAKFDGTNWTALGTGITGTIIGMKWIGSDLYVVGYIQNAGGVPVNNIAKWDGNSWSSVGQGLPYVIREIENFQNKIYVTGFPPYNSTTYLACFDGTNWNPNLGTFDRNVVGLVEYDNQLLIHGNFSTCNNDTVNGIVAFDGTSYHYFPRQGNYGTTGLAIIDTTIYILGMDGDSVKYFDGNNWQFYYGGYGTGLQLSGLFNYQNQLGLIADSLDGSSGNYYSMLKIFLPNQSMSTLLRMRNFHDMLNIDRVVTYGNSIHVVGNLDHIEDTLAISYFHFDGTNWTNPGKPAGRSYVDSWINSSVSELLKDPSTGDIYAAGHFLFAGNTYSPFISAWNGTTWHSMGQGLSSDVYKILFYNNQLYAFGAFGRTGSTWVGRSAKWTGSEWTATGTGTGFNGPVYDAVVYNNKLYACGNFTSVDGVPVNFIARFDGTNWEPAGDDLLDDIPNHLIVYDNKLIVSTDYSFGFSMWDYSSLAFLDATDLWQLMDINYSFGITSMCIHNGDLYAGNGGSSEYELYKWDGTQLNLVSTIPVQWPNGALNEYRGNLFATLSNEGFYKYDDASLTFSIVSNSLQPYAMLEDSQQDYFGGFFPYIYIGTNQVELNSLAQFSWSLPSVSLSANTDTICEHGYVYYDATCTDPFIQFAWQMPGATPDTLSFGSPIVQYNTPGTYSAFLIATNLAGTDTIYYNGTITVLPCISDVDEDSNLSASVFPNPFTSELHFHSRSPLQKIFVSDLSGKIVLSKNTDQNSIDLSMLNQGIYFMTCYSENSVQTFRIIKQ